MIKIVLSLLFIFNITSASNTNVKEPKPLVMWFDATANFARFSNLDSIIYYLDLVKHYNFTDIVIDVKPITGEVLYTSKIAPQMTKWNGYTRSNSFDYLNIFITEGHKRGLKVHASVNVFVAGHNYHNRGLVYDNPNKADWQSINYTDSGFVQITQLKHKYSAMTNPLNPKVQTHELNIMAELLTLYPNLDGIILDRVRYDGIQTDFSQLSIDAFEKFINKKIDNFPDDIYFYKKSENKPQLVRGPLFNQWLEYRASVIYNFMTEARRVCKEVNPEIIFGVYTGAWYPLYYDVGVNWASKKYDPSLEYDWATPNYKNYGYAELLDFYTTGCYFYEVTKEEVEKLNEVTKRTEAGMGEGKEYWYSVEGSAEIAKLVIADVLPVIGVLYVEQYENNIDQFIKAMNACLEKSDGLMIFDIVHLINKGWWHSLDSLVK